MSEFDKPEVKKVSSCGCGPKGCGGGGGTLGRRQFMQVAGLGLLATSAGRPLSAFAGPFEAPDTPGFPVPGNKKLAPEWIKSLYEQGKKETFRGADLESIGMPCGGIGSGQMYLTGDGTLGCWQIFNDCTSMWIGNTGSTYERRAHKKPFYQRFALSVKAGDAAKTTHLLDSTCFKDVGFKGEYPIALVNYADPNEPVKVTLEAFSPFIPLSAEDSAYPATLFHYTVENVSPKPVEVSIDTFLENPVCHKSGADFAAIRRIHFKDSDKLSMMTFSAAKSNDSDPAPDRELIVFSDFEGKNYGDWKVTGDAFGNGPAKGTLPGQQKVEGFKGEGLVNSFKGGDDTMGRMISPTFTIERRFINFLIGGGASDRTRIDLVVDGKSIRTASGKNDEKLEWRFWNVQKLEGKEAHFEIVDDAAGGWGHINIDQIEFADHPHGGVAPALEAAGDFGTMCVAYAGPTDQHPIVIHELGMPPVETNDAEYDAAEKRLGLLRPAPVTLGPGKKHTFEFAITWHFPNQVNGQYYATRWANAEAVAIHLFENHERLTRETRLWRDTFYDATMPYWLLDRLHSTVSTLATGTCQWWGNGRFYCWEGVTCCEGTCTHVWNYSHSEARLFPELARRVREMQDFRDRVDGGGFHADTGLVGFRSNDAYASDGQVGTILKAYREHLMSPDGTYLQRNWPRIKKALEFSIGHDGNDDGLIEDSQHNTYDINFEGPNTFVGGLYLAACRAAEEMAKEVGDTAFAERVHNIAEKGRANTEARLWNGEYFIHEVDLKKHPKFQYADGCLSDQLFGQGWAHQVDLGYIYDPEKVKKALQAVWRYNWAPDVEPFNKMYPPQRWFITPGHAGLFTCTWPKSEHLKEGVLYREEVWTGIEYQVAGHMIWEGMVEEALAICKAVHERYMPSLANPYNEVECGDHYARAMASWGVYLALAGFTYHGPAGKIGFDPKINTNDFKALFTTAEGWVVFEQKRKDNKQTNTLKLVHGQLQLNQVSFGIPGGKEFKAVKATINDKPVEIATRERNGRVVLALDSLAKLEEGAMLKAEFEFAAKKG